MAFFFQLNGQTYKTTNKVLIGRGAPFDNLNEFREISRAHCVVIRKKEKFYIKRLEENASISINDEDAPVGKFVEIKIGDRVSLAGHALSLMPHYEKKNYVVVNRYYSPGAALSKLNWFQTLLLFSAASFLFALVVSLATGKSFNFSNSLSFSLIIGFVVSTMYTVMGKFFGGHDEVLVNEVVIGKSGLTLHYKNKNMSINFVDMNHVYKKSTVVYIHAHGETFLVYGLKNLNNLFERILCRVPESARNTKPKQSRPFTRLAAIVILAVVNGYIHSSVDVWAKNELMITVSIGVLVLFNVLAPSYFYKIGNSKNGASLKKNVYALGLLAIVIASINGLSFVELNATRASYKECIAGTPEACSEVEYYSLKEGLDWDSKRFEAAISKICEVDSRTCEKFKKDQTKSRSRSIASGKK